MFCAPIGTEEERLSGEIWPGKWYDANPFLNLYQFGYHTGADLNLNHPHWDADRHALVYAIAPGHVSYARLYSRRVWGNIIIIEHEAGLLGATPLFTRYGHVEDIMVEFGDPVEAGTPIARVGNGEGLFPYHLHFDISTTEILKGAPWHWPGRDRKQVIRHYVDPKAFLKIHVNYQ